MALKFRYRELSPGILQYIESNLTFEPKLTYYQISHNVVAKPVSFYSIEMSPTGEREYIYLPYAFGKKLCPNYPFPQYPRSGLAFTGRLQDGTKPNEENQVAVWNEIYPKFMGTGNCRLQLATAFGKSVVGAGLACQPGGNIMVIVPISHLVSAFENVFKENTNATHILTVEDRKGPPDDRGFIREYARQLGRVPQVLVSLDTRLDWIPPDVRSQYQVLMIDEAHEWCTEKMGQKMLLFTPQYTIAMTATLKKKNGLVVMIKVLCDQKVKRKLSKPFMLYKVETRIKVPHIANNSGHMDWAKVSRWIQTSEDRNFLIARAVYFLSHIPWKGPDGANYQRKIMLLCYLRDHADSLSFMLERIGIVHSVMKGGVKVYEEQLVLVGTYEKIGTGFDEKNQCPNFSGLRFNTIGLCSSIKDHVMLEQSLGRVFRVFCPDILDFVDKYDGPKKDNFHEHYLERNKWYKDHNVTYADVKILEPIYQKMVIGQVVV